MNELTVVIPSRDMWNLGPCVNAIRKNEISPWILIVDDTPNFTLPVHYETWQPAYKIGGLKPFIFSRNCNAAIRTADDDDVILLNDDALLESPSGFTAMQRETESHPEYGIIAATTNLTGQPLQWRGTGPNAGLREVPHCAFVCVLIPRRTIKQVGLLDERYCLDYGVEDRDYCEMVRAAGLKVGVYDFCYVDHSKLTSTYRGDPRAGKDFSQNKALFHQKWPEVVW